MIKYTYKGKYLPTYLVNSCYREHSCTFVDKTLTGNGFTYSALRIKPKKDFINILIAPNKEVLKSKENFKNNELGLRVGFFYKESKDVFTPDLYDTMIFVSDSFLYYENKIANFKDRIDKITVDEYHSVLIQSKFRNNLQGFANYINDNYSNTTRVFVTATPMLFSQIDIALRPIETEKRTIKISQNEVGAIATIKSLLSNGECVLVATQDLNIVRHLSDNDVLNANLKVGDTLLLKIAEVVKIEENPESNLTLISSRGFEGFDLEDKEYNIFIFENRKKGYTSFYPQNIPQIIGRARFGTLSLNWVRISVGDRKKVTPLDKMLKVVKSKKISNEKKVSDKNHYGFLHKYFNFNYDKKLGLIADFTLKEDLYNLDVEFANCDLKGLLIYDSFFKDRGFNLTYKNDVHTELERLKIGSRLAFNNLKLNSKIIEERELVKGLVFKVSNQLSVDKIASEFRKYFRRKYYKAPNLVWKMNEREIDILSYLNNSHRELKAYRIINDESLLKSMYGAILKIQYEWKREDLKKRDFQEWKNEDGAISLNTFIQLLIGLCQQRVQVSKNIVNSRDYNITTQTGIDVVNEIADFFGRKFYELDIRTCNSRLIYAYCGLELPDNFYGENKENKKAINIMLNCLSKEYAIEKKLIPRVYKSNLKIKMKAFDFDERVINFLIETFFEKPKDALFNFCSSYEMKLIDELKHILKETSVNDNSFVRRHDSLLVFEKLTQTQKELIRDFEFLEQKGWFIKQEKNNEVFSNKLKKMIQIEV
jgi:hypothetical protein